MFQIVPIGSGIFPFVVGSCCLSAKGMQKKSAVNGDTCKSRSHRVKGAISNGKLS